MIYLGTVNECTSSELNSWILITSTDWRERRQSNTALLWLLHCCWTSVCTREKLEHGCSSSPARLPLWLVLQTICIRMWQGFLTLNNSRRCLLLIFLTPLIIEFWWLNKSFMDRLRDEKWCYLLGNSVVDCSYYNCSSIKLSVHKRSHSRTQLRDKQQQQLFTTLQQ